MSQLLEYKIARSIFEAHPGYHRGVVVLRGAKNRGNAERLQELLRAEEARVRTRLHGNIADHPEIAAWREAYRMFGAKPSEHRCSIEALARRVLKPDQLPSINPLVDIGNLVSLRYLLPAGAHPIPHSLEPLELRHASMEDVFQPLGGGALESIPPREVVFCQGENVLTRRWTWRQAAGTQTLQETTDVFFNIDGLPPIGENEVLDAMRDIARMAAEFTGAAVVQSEVLTANQPVLKMFQSQG